MGFFGKLFGKSKTEALSPELQKLFALRHRLLNDEEFQLQGVNPVVQSLITAGGAHDARPDGKGAFGCCETNPIPVNGPIGELTYLSKLETDRNEHVIFHRLGAIDTIDVFEAVTFSGSEWFLFFLDMYHPRKSKLAPSGFHLIEELTGLSGFHNFCPEFPYDYVDKRHKVEDLVGLSYMPTGNIIDALQKRVFVRPAAHKIKVDLIRKRVSSLREE